MCGNWEDFARQRNGAVVAKKKIYIGLARNRLFLWRFQ
jgi:hypothetical protein